MTTAKKILVVYPHNPFRQTMGINSRYIKLLEYLKNRSFHISLLSMRNYNGSRETEEDYDKEFLDRLFLYDFNKAYRKSRLGKILNPVSWLERLGLKRTRIHIPDYTFPSFKRYVNRLIKEEGFDFILVSYIQWAGLAEKPAAGKCRFILDLSDFTSLKLLEQSGSRQDRETLLAEEMSRVELFQQVLCISIEEMRFFSRMVPGPEYHYIPHARKARDLGPAEDREYDLLFVGSDNSYNREGLQWFFHSVYPLLNGPVKILVAGSISTRAPELQGVTAIRYVPSMDELYSKAKVTLCPLWGGTGLKIKIIEALSYGLPTVTTSIGMSGQPGGNRTGCLIADKPKDFAIAIQRLLEEPGYLINQQRDAREYFNLFFQEEEIWRRLDALFL